MITAKYTVDKDGNQILDVTLDDQRGTVRELRKVITKDGQEVIAARRQGSKRAVVSVNGNMSIVEVK